MVRQTHTLTVNATDVLPRHIYMVISEIVTLLLYVISIAFLPEYFGELYILLISKHASLLFPKIFRSSLPLVSLGNWL